MDDDEDLQVVGTTSDHLIQQLTDENGKDFAVEYLKSGFMSSAVNTLFYMRQQAGLTQAQVAERLNTKQSAIARLEGDVDGSISLRRYIDFALACGMVPHEITFAPLEAVISYTIDQPKIPYTQVNYQEWLKANSLPTSVPVESVVQVEGNSEATDKRHQSQNAAVFSVERSSGGACIDNSTIASSAITLQNDISNQKYFQPYLMSPLQLLSSDGRTSVVQEAQGKISNLAPSKVS